MPPVASMDGNYWNYVRYSQPELEFILILVCIEIDRSYTGLHKTFHAIFNGGIYCEWIFCCVKRFQGLINSSEPGCLYTNL